MSVCHAHFLHSLLSVGHSFVSSLPFPLFPFRSLPLLQSHLIFVQSSSRCFLSRSLFAFHLPIGSHFVEDDTHKSSASHKAYVADVLVLLLLLLVLLMLLSCSLALCYRFFFLFPFHHKLILCRSPLRVVICLLLLSPLFSCIGRIRSIEGRSIPTTMRTHSFSLSIDYPCLFIHPHFLSRRVGSIEGRRLSATQPLFAI